MYFVTIFQTIFISIQIFVNKQNDFIIFVIFFFNRLRFLVETKTFAKNFFKRRNLNLLIDFYNESTIDSKIFRKLINVLLINVDFKSKYLRS